MCLLCISLLFMVLFHLGWSPSPARVKTSPCQAHVSVVHAPPPEWSVIRSMRSRDETRLWCQPVKCGEPRQRRRQRWQQEEKKPQNLSHELFKPLQSLQRSQTGHDPERNVQDAAEHWSETFRFLIWNHFQCFSPLFFFIFPFCHFASTPSTSGLDSSLVCIVSKFTTGSDTGAGNMRPKSRDLLRVTCDQLSHCFHIDTNLEWRTKNVNVWCLWLVYVSECMWTQTSVSASLDPMAT